MSQNTAGKSISLPFLLMGKAW